ncbi:hypothetical protein B0T24DRAFT_353428 [Lasiosphaeria ovina]|uniref:Uncharacterized protein n=1 Tax=Lasiosphaeria ovina TaxID=92902 RepID=A0AAE0K3Z8_9PEZI|nr:hypothetical protein B0T24DRAFT_353428 [Lasiosphaeria ovina]
MSSSVYPFTSREEVKGRNARAVKAFDLQLLEIQSLKYPNFDDNGGDVLAVVTFDQESDRGYACDGAPWPDVQIRMSRDKLLRLGSSKIADMFDDRRQRLYRRRWGSKPLPPGIEYILDFTPPLEGAELADLTAALWLPRMVKLWFLAGHYEPNGVLAIGPDPTGFQTRPLADMAVGAVLALGHDDICKAPNCPLDFSYWEVQTVPGIVGDDSPSSQSAPRHIPDFRKVDDYCRVRHRAAVMRVLHAINGKDLLLNSATRMWTVAQVAIYLEVPSVVVGPVTQWLLAEPNTKFMEICPEKAYQLALALRIPGVLTHTFKIMVNENAIDLAATNPSPRLPPVTWAQRRRDDYGDFPSDAIEYASRAMVERMSANLAMLQADDVFERLPAKIGEWEKMRRLGALIEQFPACDLKSAYNALSEATIAAFHDLVGRTLEFRLPDNYFGDLLRYQRTHYVPESELVDLADLYKKLNATQRSLTPFFWESLRRADVTVAFGSSFYNGKTLSMLATEFKDLLWEARDILELSGHHMDMDMDMYTFRNTVMFDHTKFFAQLMSAVKVLCLDILHPKSDELSEFSGLRYVLSDHLLLTLEEKEMNYLPLWAGGLDDGSGGVFQDAIPPAEMGPSEPGPGYHTGYTVASETDTETMGCASTITPSDLSFGGLDIDDTSTVRSMDAEQSASSGLPRNRVVAAPSVSSETFSANDAEYADAMFLVPAHHQAHGQALASYVENYGDHDAASQTTESATMTASDMEDGSSEEAQGDEDMEFFFEDDMDLSDDGSSTLDGFEDVGDDSAMPS